MRGETTGVPRDFVCLRSRPNDTSGFHTAVKVQYDGPRYSKYCVPPNTLLQVEKVEGPPFIASFPRWTKGTKPKMFIIDWLNMIRYNQNEKGEFVSKKGEHVERWDPSATIEKAVNRRLLTCTLTFLCPSKRGALTEEQRAKYSWIADDIAAKETFSKFGGDVRPLVYADRRAYVRGIEEFTGGLRHTMEHEWTREPSTVWSDVKAVRYTGKEVWAYVIGPATAADCTPGRRDVNNVGRRPVDFKQLADNHILSRCPQAKEADLLVIEEVLAIRLYTGPAFDPINWWLRQVAMLPLQPPSWHPLSLGVWTKRRGKMDEEAARKHAARDASTSFAMTVWWLASALRKLAAANTAFENTRKLYRCMRGAITGSFWLPDPQGIVCAVDTAFMSTALEAVPHYLDEPGKASVVLELHAGEPDDTGYHCGAEVAFLSQFLTEQEVIFPPLTMLRVMTRRYHLKLPKKATPEEIIAWSREKHRVQWDRTPDGRHFEQIAVAPSFT